MSLGRSTLAIAGAGLVLASAVSPAQSVQTGAVSAAQQEGVTAAVELAEGGRFEGGTWALEVQDSFVVPSGTRFGYSEVRVAVAFQNLTEEALPYEWIGLSGEPGYPSLFLRDGSGTEIGLDRARLQSSSVPGSALVALPGSIPARWTIGYQVPTAFAGDLTLVAHSDGIDVGEWSLTGEGAEVYPGWAAPQGVAPVRWGDGIAWAPDLSVAPLGHDVEVCGDASREYVVTVYGLAVQVQNTGTVDASWPGVNFPLDTAIAVWTDGGSARNGGLTFAETFLEDASGAPSSDPLQGLSAEARTIPPQTTHLRMLGFSLPRDGRFGSAFALPQSVALYPPSGAPTWLDTAGDELIDFTVPAEVCADVMASVPFDVVPPA